MSAVNVPPRLMGKLPPKIDKRTLLFENYVVPQIQAVSVPPAQNWRYAVNTWPMFLNDRIGCCTISSKGHIIQELTANASTEAIVSDSSILSAYEAISGYQPGVPSTDTGCYMLDTENYWRKRGIGGHKILAYVKISPQNSTNVKTAIYVCGCMDVGLNLPISAAHQTEAGATWSCTTGRDSAPGSWGGHAVPVIGFNADVLCLVTWGMVYYMTWAFLNRYCDEAYVPITQDWLNKQGTSPSGLNITQIIADAHAIAA